MTAQSIDPYDKFQYPNYCYPQTHPDRIASLATLLGMKPAPVEKCRVLELACGDGANILPMGFDLPGTEFLGIDRATQPVARGMMMIEELGIKNVKLEVADILELPPAFGKFDYILAHGLYSWVPAEVREKILELCRSSLNPQGIAYISYNVYPGCHLRAIVRGMMLYHTRSITDPAERVAQARQLMRWVTEAQTAANGYALFLREFNEAVSTRDGAALFHDDMADVNTPFYFYQFVTDAARHGLKFLSEAEYFNTHENSFSPEVALQLQEMEKTDLLGKEQYLDFLEGRSFRQTLLCHQEVEIDRRVKPELAKLFYIRADTTPESTTPDLLSDAIELFKGPKESKIATSFPLAKAAMMYLGNIFPHSVKFEEVLADSRKMLGQQIIDDVDGPMSEDALTLGEIILKACGAGVTELSLHQPAFTTEPGERPKVSPLARLQSQYGPIVTSLLFNSVKFDDSLSRQLLLLLDGTRDRQMLLEEFSLLMDQAATAAGQEAETAEREKFRTELSQRLEEKLKDLGKLGFLTQP